MKYILIPVLLLICFNDISSQYKMRSVFELDPLIDSAKVHIKKDPAKAFEFAMQALENSFRNKDKRNEAYCYKIIGDINFEVEQYDLATDNYKKALNLFKQSDDIDMIKVVTDLLAKSYSENNQFDKSEELYLKAEESAKQRNNPKEINESRKKLASIYSKKGQSESAISKLEEVRSSQLKDSIKNDLYTTNNLLIKEYSVQKSTKAIDLTLENESIAEQTKDTTELLNVLQTKADVYEKLENPNEQLNTLYKSLEVRKTKADLPGISHDNYKIGKVLLDQQQTNRAIEHLQQSIEESDRENNLETKKLALKSLSMAYDDIGKFNQAYNTYKEYVAVSEKIIAEKENGIKENMLVIQSLSKGSKRLDMLENQKLLNDKTIQLLEQEQILSNKSITQQKIIIVSLLITVVFLVISVILINKSSKQKRIANQLLALRSLRSQMNPHFIFNALNSVNAYISTNDERSANKFLSEFSRLMRSVMENSKYDFVSLSSEIQIIQLYLKLEQHRFKDKFDFTVNIDDSIAQDNIQIPPMFIQPYIENAVWHGLRYKEEKGYLKVSFKNGSNIKVIIEDNGIGRKRSQELKTVNQRQNQSTGLSNIENRLKIINQLYNTKLNVQIEDLDKINKTGTKVTIELLDKTIT